VPEKDHDCMSEISKCNTGISLSACKNTAISNSIQKQIEKTVPYLVMHALQHPLCDSAAAIVSLQSKQHRMDNE